MRKKKIIGIILAAALVAGGLGSFAYANPEPVNYVHAHFDTSWVYDSSEDSFSNHEVTGRKEWHADMWNEPDETGAPVFASALSLYSDLVFDGVWPEEDLTKTGPPTYEWSYGDIPEWYDAYADVNFWSPEPYPVTFTPGFDASRSADKTGFSVLDTQTLTITLTPREVTEGFCIRVNAWEDDLVNPVIISPTTDEEQGIWLNPDGHWLDMELTGLTVGTTYTYYVTIEVTPKVPEVEFIPYVEVYWHEEVDSGTTRGSSVSYPAGAVGTWTWSAEGNYVWHWCETVCRGVIFPEYRRVNHVGANFVTTGIYTVPGDTFINREVTGSAEWTVPIDNWSDETGAAITGLTVTLDSQLEFDRVEPENLVTMGPPTYEWSFGDFPEGGLAAKGIRFLSPEPYPVTFTPGFDASRSLDKTEFLQSEGTQTQTVTIMVTPREPQVVMEGYWIVVVAADNEHKAPDEYDLVDAVITGAEWVPGHVLLLFPTGLELGQEWTTTVEIQVTPKVPRVEFIPCVQVYWFEPRPFGGTAVGNSVSHAVEQMGTWTVSAEGSYVWHWGEIVGRAVEWQSCYRVKIEDFAIKDMVIDFDPRPDHDKIEIRNATFRLQEGATCDLAVDDVTVTVDGVVITIPAGSFVKGRGGDYIFKTPRGVEPKVEMKLNFDKGEWSFKVDKIDVGIVDSLDGVDVTLSIGSMGASEHIEMWIDRLLYKAES